VATPTDSFYEMLHGSQTWQMPPSLLLIEKRALVHIASKTAATSLTIPFFIDWLGESPAGCCPWQETLFSQQAGQVNAPLP